MQTFISPVRSIPRITFRRADRSAALEEEVLDLSAQLRRFHDITDCRIVIEGPSYRHTTDGIFTVSFEIAIPGGVIHATSGHTARPEHSDPYTALRDAFENAKRQLKNFAAAD
jgi:hypothetical protein